LENIKKILIIKLCCIGDIIQTIPSLKAFKQKDTEIHFLCIEWVKDLIDMIPFVDKKIIINLKNLFDIVKVIMQLRKEKYDLVVNYHRDLKSYIFTNLISAKNRAGFKWKNYEKFLTHKFTFNSNEHESLRYLSIAEGLGFKRKDVFTELKLPQMNNIKIELKGEKKVGLFPGGGKNPGTVMFSKRWPIENFIKLSELLKQKNVEVYFIGGEMDREIMPYNKFKIIITRTLKELAFYISKMDVFVAGDTGPLHMSVALGVKTIGLYGPSSPELVAPPNKNAEYIWQKIACSPCYEPETVHKREFLKCKDNVCMKNIEVKEVFGKIIYKLKDN